jgi:hypothetical protein
MKAQFATIEAAMSFFAILSVVSLVASQMNAGALELRTQRGRALQAIAVHDIMDAIVKNASANACVFSPGCGEVLAAEYGNALGAPSVAFVLGGLQFNSSYANSTEKCLPVGVTGTNETEEVCVVAGG